MSQAQFQALPASAARPAAQTAVGVWLFCVAGLTLAMILVGGATRLTDSGLSITRWDLVHGVIPPLNPAQWQEEFERYRQIPEYRLQNKGMSLAEFQFIFWWEWAHRLLGRVIGLAFGLPLIVFALMKAIPRGLTPRLAAMFALGGLQGAIGWWMVSSGLTGDRLDVAAYRLATHLSLAFILLSLLVWSALDVFAPKAAGAGERSLVAPAIGFVALLAVQIVLGAFVAGTDAGFVFNDWPTMGGAWLPQGYFDLQPLGRNFTENPVAIQFNHRIGAYVVCLAALGLWLACRTSADKAVRHAGLAVFAATLAQAALGVATLTAYGAWTPPQVAGVLIGVAHQGFGAVLWVAAILTVRAACGGRRVAGRL
jgi:cytochrome c oxidase assembly protein subunit 15